MIQSAYVKCSAVLAGVLEGFYYSSLQPSQGMAHSRSLVDAELLNRSEFSFPLVEMSWGSHENWAGNGLIKRGGVPSRGRMSGSFQRRAPQGHRDRLITSGWWFKNSTLEPDHLGSICL